jgi:hypothetical protein
MSHRAYIAVPSRKDTGFDVYTSQNGGESFHLFEALQDYSRNALSRLQELPSKVPDGMVHTEAVANSTKGVEITNTARQQPIVNEEPLVEEYQREEIFENLDYLTRDVLYLVTSDSVEVYYLSWSGVIQQSILSGTGTLRVYPEPAALPNMPPQNETPYYELSGEAFHDINKADKRRPDAPPQTKLEEALARDHMTVFTGLTQCAARGITDVRCMGAADYTYIFDGKLTGPDILQTTQQQGVAINATPDRVPPEIVFKDVRNRANKIRWYHNLEWASRMADSDHKEVLLDELLSELNEKYRDAFGDIVPATMNPPSNRELV